MWLIWKLFCWNTDWLCNDLNYSTKILFSVNFDLGMNSKLFLKHPVRSNLKKIAQDIDYLPSDKPHDIMSSSAVEIYLNIIENCFCQDPARGCHLWTMTTNSTHKFWMKIWNWDNLNFVGIAGGPEVTTRA